MTALIVGLGNPGPEYAKTRHNVGQAVVAELARRNEVTLSRHKSNAAVGTLRLEASGEPGSSALLAVPLSYMNLSGGPVAALARYHKVAPEEVVVVHDDLDLPYGTIRLKRGGGEGGHNGLRSVTRSLKSADYVRVRLGIGRPRGGDAVAYVLRPFSPAQRKALPAFVDDAIDAVEMVLAEGLEAAQRRFHAPG